MVDQTESKEKSRRFPQTPEEEHADIGRHNLSSCQRSCKGRKKKTMGQDCQHERKFLLVYRPGRTL